MVTLQIVEHHSTKAMTSGMREDPCWWNLDTETDIEAKTLGCHSLILIIKVHCKMSGAC